MKKLCSALPANFLCAATLLLLPFLWEEPGMGCYAQSFQWAKSVGSSTDDWGYSIAVDGSGNCYITGFFTGTADFDPSAAVANLTSVGSTDIFFAKYNSNGNYLWAKSVGSSSSGDGGNSIAVDGSGNCYITGWFNGTADFDPSAAVANLTSVCVQDIFFAKYDSYGNYLWAKSVGSCSTDNGTSIAVDVYGNSYITGYFYGTVDFDPSATVANLTPVGGSDIFFAKYDSNGDYLWAKSVGSSSNDRCYNIAVDGSGNSYITGYFNDTADFDPSATIANLTSVGADDIFFAKYDSSGNYFWAKSVGSSSNDRGSSIAVDGSGNSYITGSFFGTADFDPSAVVANLTPVGSYDIFFAKYDSNGNYFWAKSVGSSLTDKGYGIVVDGSGNSYITGSFSGTADFDPSAAVANLTSVGGDDIFFAKYDSNGNYLLAKSVGSSTTDIGYSIAVNGSGNSYITGSFFGTADFDPDTGTANLTPVGGFDIFILKLSQKGVLGSVYNDINIDCVKDINETGLTGRLLTITPGNIIVQTDDAGIWFLDSLPAGTYTLTVDTSGYWQRTCLASQTFIVINPDSITEAPSFGFISTAPCAAPNVSLHTLILRPCFSNQNVFVQACNLNIATGVLDSAYAEVQLDPLLTVQSATLPYTALGNNTYRFNIGTLNPGMCMNFSISCSLSCNAVIGQTLCVQADLYPADSCVFDTIADPFPPSVSPCTTPWDNSSLLVDGYCINDTIRFVIYNTGDPVNGDMTCFSPVRIYIDGQLIILDSVQLAGSDSTVFAFSGDGRTWRLEADQHPLHPGNSHPNATLELCGNSINWTPDLVNTLPMNDADPVTDIYCGLVTGSYDPNDKTGYPTGVPDSNFIAPNGQLQYVIRFQNTGTDTAFKVVLRDTLPLELGIFSVVPGVTSHNYSFYMHGPRVLEWTFDNILLPDSNANEPASHGFVTFKVNQSPGLPNGTVINNSADIYFDFNVPVLTNQTIHRINDMLQTIPNIVQSNIAATICNSYTLNGFTYSSPGTYYQNTGDTLIILNLTNTVNTSVTQSGNTLNTNTASAIYQWIDCDNAFTPVPGETNQSFTPSVNGSYAVIVTENSCSDTSACVNVTGLSTDLSMKNNAGFMVYPNPFDMTTTFMYTLPEKTDIRLEIYNMLGKKIKTIVNEPRQKGVYTIHVSFKDELSGIYFFRFQTNTEHESGRIVLIKN